MKITQCKFMLFFLWVLVLTGCGGGGGGGGGAATGAVVSTLSFPLRQALNYSITHEAAINYSISGSCSGTARLVNPSATPASFEGVSGVSVASTLQMGFSNCTPTTIVTSVTDYFDANYLPLGKIIAGGGYGVYLTPLNIPAQVKVGDTGTIGTMNAYTNQTKSASTGRDVLSFTVAADTVNTALVNLITKSYDAANVLIATTQDQYRIDSNGVMTPLSSDIQALQMNGSTLHLILTVVPDIAPPSVLSTTPINNASDVPVTSAVSVTFSEPLTASSVNASTFTLSNSAGSAVAGTVTYTNATARFTPATAFAPSETYTATITNGVKDLAGNALVNNYSWGFVTNASVLMPPSIIATGSWAEAVAIGDVNGDGRNDVVMTTSYSFDPINDYKVFVFTQNASGGFNPPIKYATSSTYTCRASSVAIGDLNQDGKNDVAIGNAGCGVEVFTQNTLGSLNAGVLYASIDSNKIRIADMNNDGFQDIVGIGWGTNTASIWLQNAGGALSAPVTYAVTHGGWDDLEVGDVNSDGRIDIVVASGQGLSSGIGILMQTVAGTFSPPTYYSLGVNIAAQGVAVGDVNGDSLNDIVVTYGGNKPASMIGVFTQNALGTLNLMTSYVSYDIPESVEVADITGDGRKDIITLHGGWSSMGVYQQRANGTLQNEYLYPIPYASQYNPHGLAIGDVNSDGKNDVVHANSNAGLVISYHN